MATEIAASDYFRIARKHFRSTRRTSVRVWRSIATPPEDTYCLLRTAKIIEPNNVLEIGTFYGETTLALADNLPKATIYTIDICKEMKIDIPSYQRSEVLRRSRVGEAYLSYGATNVISITGDSRKRSTFRPLKSRCVDLAFIDGNHSYEAVIRDSINVLAVMKPRGAILWHDYKDNGRGDVKAALRQLSVARGLTIYHIKGTWLAACLLGAREQV
jgi:hypothetical protein